MVLEVADEATPTPNPARPEMGRKFKPSYIIWGFFRGVSVTHISLYLCSIRDA